MQPKQYCMRLCSRAVFRCIMPDMMSPGRPEDMEHREGRELDPHSVVVVTGTRYPGWGTESVEPAARTDAVRGELALATLREAKQQGYQVEVVDGGSSPEFLARLGAEDIDARPELERGMSAARQQGFR